MATLAIHPAMHRLRPAATIVPDGAPPEAVGKDLGRVADEQGRRPFATRPQAAPAMLQTSKQTAPEADPARAAARAEAAQVAGWVASCLHGDAHAWELLVRKEQRRVYGLCYRFTGSATEAEDMTQEVFLKVYRNLPSFDPGKATFGVWLTALTRNLLVDHYRRTRADRITESLDGPVHEDDAITRLDQLPETRPGQERYVAGVELRARVQDALARVSPELREAVILRDLEDMDYAEIAAVLHIPQGTVKSRISRGRAELARLLKSLEGQVI